MRRCPECQAHLSDTTRFCPHCGKQTQAANPDEVETVAIAVAPPSTGLPHSGVDQRFPPGMLIASRYRIISRLGKGGMGEVFRADDLVLGQAVALKFLPPQSRGNAGLLKRFYDEVRIARQISHKNVCRVYDIGEVEGQPYLSMEYIDGEDLGSLLRRIGRLPADKATEFARKLCAGVAAAHAQGVLHRDIKPGNIMIDSRGELRVTDFGLAGLADHMQGAEIRNGTPAYMAPEQLAGKEVSAQSDLYAVGLVLYEMFTGKLPFSADSIAEITRMREENRITSPTSMVADMDKSVERAILKCLDADPRLRPSSALALAASLPGGDPLAAALAEGETPSPEAVAAAGSHEGLNPKIAVAAMAAFAVALAVFCIVKPRIAIMNRLPMENPPDVLVAKAREIAKSVGYTERPADSVARFYAYGQYIPYLTPKVKDPDAWFEIMTKPPSPLGLWYRQSPRALVTTDSSAGNVQLENPFPAIPGMFVVNMDADGRLRRFAAVPPEHEAPQNSPPPDWTPLFAAAGLDPAKLETSDPEWVPLAATDARAAWKGVYMDRDDIPIRVEAAAFHGKPIYFEVVWPWTRGRTPAPPTTAGAIRSIIGAVIFLATALVARYNWKAGRADPRSAVRIGVYCAGMSMINWAVGTHHVATPAELTLATEALSNAAFNFMIFWMVYLALEPWVRRYWPQAMITWTRLLAGRWRDPMVGRDVLFGVTFGVLSCLLFVGLEWASLRMGAPLLTTFGIDNLSGTRRSIAAIANFMNGALNGGLGMFLLLFLARIVLRKQWLAALAFVALLTYFDNMQRGLGSMELGQALSFVGLYTLIYTIAVLIMLRFGFFALMVTLFIINVTLNLYLTLDFGAWYGGSSLIIIVLLIALTAWGFRTALAGRPVFSGLMPEPDARRIQ